MVGDDNIVTTESRSITSGTYTIPHPIKSACLHTFLGMQNTPSTIKSILKIVVLYAAKLQFDC